MTVFEMVEKGWEYKVVDTDIQIKKSYQRKRTTNTGFSTLDNYRDTAVWTVYGLDEHTIYTFGQLKNAKKFVAEKLWEREGK